MRSAEARDGTEHFPSALLRTFELHATDAKVFQVLAPSLSAAAISHMCDDEDGTVSTNFWHFALQDSSAE